jgi:hypothetical protein
MLYSVEAHLHRLPSASPVSSFCNRNLEGVKNNVLAMKRGEKNHIATG